MDHWGKTGRGTGAGQGPEYLTLPPPQSAVSPVEIHLFHDPQGRGTGSESVLHLGLKPGSIFITRDGKVMVGSFGLTRSPTTLPQGGALQKF